MSVRTVAKEVRLSYVKVAEFQRRGSVHLHALVRLDAVGDELGAPPERFTGDLLAAALELAARRVSAHAREATTKRMTESGGVGNSMWRSSRMRTPTVAVRPPIWPSTRPSRPRTTGCSITGSGPGCPKPSSCRRICATWSKARGVSAGKKSHEELRLRAWAHTAGYRGHCLTKSRRFSTTFAALRGARQEWTVAEKTCRRTTNRRIRWHRRRHGRDRQRVDLRRHGIHDRRRRLVGRVDRRRGTFGPPMRIRGAPGLIEGGSVTKPSAAEGGGESRHARVVDVGSAEVEVQG